TTVRPAGALVGKQPLLALNAPCIAREIAASADHTVTRDDDGDWIRAVCRADRAAGAGPADARGQPTVRRCGPARNAPQGRPDFALEGCAAARDFDCVE